MSERRSPEFHLYLYSFEVDVKKMSNVKGLLYTYVNDCIKERFPMTVNGYTLKYSVDVYDCVAGCEDNFTVVGKGYIYTKDTMIIEEDTEYGRKATWKDELTLMKHYSESFTFSYKKSWLNDEYIHENESLSHYIFSNAPSETVEDIRNTINRFISHLVQDCVDLKGQCDMNPGRYQND